MKSSDENGTLFTEIISKTIQNQPTLRLYTVLYAIRSLSHLEWGENRQNLLKLHQTITMLNMDYVSPIARPLKPN